MRKIELKIDVTAIQVVQNRQQTHDWTLIGSGANGLGIQECKSQPTHSHVSTNFPNLKRFISYDLTS